MSESKSLGRKLLNIFFEDAPASPNPSPEQPVSVEPKPAAQTVSGSPDHKFIEHFATVLEKNNLPGADYFEFRATLKNLSNLGLQEEQQFQAAWASFRALNKDINPSLLTSTANQYLTTLQSDREAFLRSVDLAVQEKVGGLQNEQKSLQQENENLTRQIVEIQNKIASNKERLVKITGEVDEQSGKLQQNRANYEATFLQFTQEINKDIQKIGQYLK
ncbi:hypothetical protein [Siphonobacter sp. SORGH_AS_0500]|uniref:hypothetical protein n=1 Tax=Siphonobacter sp. SORGH_AS_0500 TaxID=1864824 RepID=UPI0028662D45|nr:hypothetical protein [Siphonobacter sp. SORGH_AS_0500]MDR6194970.1 chromosome segregation ATPase [Siphonobacter sp. SORGH_AS_0500]